MEARVGDLNSTPASLNSALQGRHATDCRHKHAQDYSGENPLNMVRESKEEEIEGSRQVQSEKLTQ